MQPISEVVFRFGQMGASPVITSTISVSSMTSAGSATGAGAARMVEARIRKLYKQLEAENSIFLLLFF